MNITLKLFATLGDYLPAGAHYNQIDLSLTDGTTVPQALEPFHLPPKLVHLVLVNGHFIPPPQRTERVLHEGDVLAVWPPIAGG